MVGRDHVHGFMMGYSSFVMNDLFVMHSSCYNFVMGHSINIVSSDHNRHSFMGNSMHRLHHGLMFLVYKLMNCSHRMHLWGFCMNVVCDQLDWLNLFMSQDGCRFNNWMH